MVILGNFSLHFFVDTEKDSTHRLYLDKQGFSGVLLMNLLKFLDTINHEIVIAKLKLVIDIVK